MIPKIQQTNFNNPYKSFNAITNKELLKSHVSAIEKTKEIEHAEKKKFKKQNIFAVLMALAAVAAIGVAAYKKQDYKGELAKGLSLETGKKISKSQLSCVVDKKEFVEILKNLKEENYVASSENILQGIFQADLHSHTWHSDGWGITKNIMDDVARYADELNKKTGKKFVFSITDHDTIKATKEALEIIADNPSKFQNVKFVPGVELSFIQQNSIGNFEGAEVLAHCINPYSKKLNSFIDNLHKNRGSMIENALNKLNSAFGENSFLREDMCEYYLKNPDENFAYDLRWRVLNYAQVKNKVNELADFDPKKAHGIYHNLMKQWRTGKNNKDINSFVKFIAPYSYDTSIPKNNDKIAEICSEFFPKIENNKIICSSENTFEDIINLFEKEKGAVLGFAHPVFTFKSFENQDEAIEKLIKKSKGLIKTSEKFHQGYSFPIKNGVISQEEVSNINQKIDKYNLLLLGGRDNHAAKFL